MGRLTSSSSTPSLKANQSWRNKRSIDAVVAETGALDHAGEDASSELETAVVDALADALL
jgi:hypothetical protein